MKLFSKKGYYLTKIELKVFMAWRAITFKKRLNIKIQQKMKCISLLSLKVSQSRYMLIVLGLVVIHYE